MKKIFLITAAICVILLNLCNLCFAQSPQSFKYQAVARNSTGDILTNQSISIRISIHETSTGGPVVYEEEHVSETTNEFGLVNLEIGNGSVLSGTFSAIDWGSNDHFIEIEMDETGGTTYQVMGTSQLLSVPYALHAKTAEAVTETDPVFGISVASGITGTDTTNWNNKLDTEVDADPTNELQNLSLSGDTLFIGSGNYVILDIQSIYNSSFVCGDILFDFRDGQN